MPDVDWSWSTTAAISSFALLLTTFGYLFYWYLAGDREAGRRLGDRFGDRGAVVGPLLQKAIGVVIFGGGVGGLALLVLPYDLVDYGLVPVFSAHSLSWLAGLCLLLVALAARAARRPEGLDSYPQVRARVWTGTLILVNTLAWAAYLFTYEFMFRGVLLVACVRTLGTWPAIAINGVVYALAHFPKGRDETVGSVLFGIVLSYATLSTGTLWVPVLAHITLAVANDMFSVRAHPDMAFDLTFRATREDLSS